MAKSAAPLLLLGGAFLLLAGGKKKKGGSGGSSVANAENFYSVNGMRQYEDLVERGSLRGRGVVIALLTGTGDAQLFGVMKGQAAATPHINFLVARGQDARGLALENNQAAGPGIADPTGALVVAFKPSQNTSGDPMMAYAANVSPLVKNVRSGKSPGPAMSVGSAVAYIEEETGKPSTSTYPGGGGSGSGGSPPSTGGAESESETWKARQNGLKILGYTEVGQATGQVNAATSAAIKLFQRDWNGLMAYLGSIGSPAVGKSPYTDADEDGACGPATQARYDKAMHEFGNPPVEAEDLMMSFNSFRDLIVELRSRT